MRKTQFSFQAYLSQSIANKHAHICTLLPTNEPLLYIIANVMDFRLHANHALNQHS